MCVWGGRTVEKDTNHIAYNSKAKLIDNIKEAFEPLTKDIMKAACARFQSQIETVVDAEGGFFECIVF